MSWLYPKRLVGVLVLSAMLLPGVADAKRSSSGGHGHSSATRSGTHANSGHSSGHASTHNGSRAKAPGIPRDSHGRIERSANAKANFQRSHPCPSTGKSSGACPGYVVDHRQGRRERGAEKTVTGGT